MVPHKWEVDVEGNSQIVTTEENLGFKVANVEANVDGRKVQRGVKVKSTLAAKRAAKAAAAAAAMKQG